MLCGGSDSVMIPIGISPIPCYLFCFLIFLEIAGISHDMLVLVLLQ